MKENCRAGGTRAKQYCGCRCIVLTTKTVGNGDITAATTTSVPIHLLTKRHMEHFSDALARGVKSPAVCAPSLCFMGLAALTRRTFPYNSAPSSRARLAWLERRGGGDS